MLDVWTTRDYAKKLIRNSTVVATFIWLHPLQFGTSEIYTHTLTRSWTHTLFQIKHKYIQIDKLWLERLSNMGLIQFYNKQCSYTLKIESFDAPNVWKLLDPNLIYMYHNKWIKERMSIDTTLVNCNLWCSFMFAFHFKNVQWILRLER